MKSIKGPTDGRENEWCKDLTHLLTQQQLAAVVCESAKCDDHSAFIFQSLTLKWKLT